MKSKHCIQRLFLIGMPGVGKTTLGQEIAFQMKTEFVDLDDIIEQKVELSVQNYFHQKGEEFFRLQEAICLRGFAKSGHTLLACGGGTPCFHDNLNWMKRNGKVLYLKTNIEKIVRNITFQHTQRPLVGQDIQQYVERTLSNRAKWYQQADVILEYVNDVKEIFHQPHLQQILNELGQAKI